MDIIGTIVGGAATGVGLLDIDIGVESLLLVLSLLLFSVLLVFVVTITAPPHFPAPQYPPIPAMTPTSIIANSVVSQEVVHRFDGREVSIRESETSASTTATAST